MAVLEDGEGRTFLWQMTGVVVCPEASDLPPDNLSGDTGQYDFADRTTEAGPAHLTHSV